MKIIKYINSMLPSFSRDQLNEDLDTIADELRNHVLPVYVTAAKEFGSQKFYSDDAQKLDDYLNKEFTFKYKGNHLSGILQVLNNIDGQVKLLQSMVDGHFAVDITNTGLDSVRVNILQLVETMSFVVRYARRHLNLILVSEAGYHSGKPVKDTFSVGTLDWLSVGREPFARGLNVLSQPPKVIEDKLKDIPKVLINSESVETTESILGRDKTDPFQMRFIPLVLNPIYHIRMRVAEYQAARYREAKEERGIIELRIMLLKEQRGDRTDARIEKQIAYNEGRLEKLVYKVEELGGQYDD